MKETDIQTYISLAARRKWWIIIPLLLCLLGGFTYIMVVPRLYEAVSVIFVQDQKVPEDVVRPMIESIENRVTLVTQQVLSRRSLERIIRKYDLYRTYDEMLPEDKIQLFKERIMIEPTYQTIQSKRTNAKFKEIFSTNRYSIFSLDFMFFFTTASCWSTNY